jgi:hypothetical protein
MGGRPSARLFLKLDAGAGSTVATRWRCRHANATRRAFAAGAPARAGESGKKREGAGWAGPWRRRLRARAREEEGGRVDAGRFGQRAETEAVAC